MFQLPTEPTNNNHITNGGSPDLNPNSHRLAVRAKHRRRTSAGAASAAAIRAQSHSEAHTIQLNNPLEDFFVCRNIIYHPPPPLSDPLGG